MNHSLARLTCTDLNKIQSFNSTGRETFYLVTVNHLNCAVVVYLRCSSDFSACFQRNCFYVFTELHLHIASTFNAFIFCAFFRLDGSVSFPFAAAPTDVLGVKTFKLI